MKRCFLFFITLTLLPSHAFANCDESGRCVFDCTPEGSTGSCTATLEGDTLTISGTGEMKSYDFNYEGAGGLPTSNPAPWYQETVARGNITKVVVEEGITSVGRHAFEDMSSLREVVLPAGLTSIGNEAFANINLQKINLPKGLTSLPYYAVSPTVSELVIPSTVTYIGSYTLPYNAETLVIPESVTYLSENAFVYTSCPNCNLQNIYCPENLKTQCDNAIALLNGGNKSVNVITYQTTPDGQIFYNNKWYNNANDILGGEHIKKRIYTVEEATKLSKDTGNIFKLRYK